MRDHSAALSDVLRGSHTRTVTANIWHGDTLMLEDVPVTGWSLDSDLTAEVKTSGQVQVVVVPPDGRSVLPSGTAGVLSPFHATVQLDVTVTAGGFSERVSLGRFRCVRTGDTSEFAFRSRQGRWVTADLATLTVASLDVGVQRDGLLYPEQPPSTLSCWGEVRRLTLMPVRETVPDRPITGRQTWEAEQGGRLKAVQVLCGMLGGTGVVNSDGAWEVVPNTPTDPVVVLRADGPYPDVLDAGFDVDTDAVYNRVVGVFEQGDDKATIYAVADAVGDLAPGGDYGTYTRYYDGGGLNNAATTQAQADATVRGVLAQSLSALSYDVPVVVRMDPTVEVGDMVRLDGWDRPVLGRAVRVSVSDAATMTVTVRVPRGLV